LRISAKPCLGILEKDIFDNEYYREDDERITLKTVYEVDEWL
jgi:hypothetical protein